MSPLTSSRPVSDSGGHEMLVDVGNTPRWSSPGRGDSRASCPAGLRSRREVTYGCRPRTAPSKRYAWRRRCLPVETIGDAAPLGLCGSGLIDLIAELRRAAG